MKPSKTPPSDLLYCFFAIEIFSLLLLISSWGFVPHRHLHAKAWSALPVQLRHALGNDPTPLISRATDADSRKHTDSLESPRHFIDLDDAATEGLQLWGQNWADAKRVLIQRDSSLSSKRYGILPWQLEWSYKQLVNSWSPKDSTEPDLDRVIRAAADLGHYLSDAHVPLHTSGNYDGQRTGQRGIHALWETHAVEWLLYRRDLKACGKIDALSMPYDPVWTPWEVIQESHALVPEILAAERTWTALCAKRGQGFQRRGRTMHLAPTSSSLAIWDSLTNGHTWPRYCIAAQRIAAAWHSAWLDAGRPLGQSRSRTTWRQKLALYLPKRWSNWLLTDPNRP